MIKIVLIVVFSFALECTSVAAVCTNCTGLCSLSNHPQTSISNVNPIVVINGTTYNSSIYQTAQTGCSNCAYSEQYPATSDASVLDNLQNGQFIGVFTCPIAMCLCTDKLNSTIDCYQGNSSAQIALFAYNLTGSAVIIGIVLQSIVTRAGSTYSPPTLYPNGTYPSLASTNYLKINHFACVNSTNATNPSVCPNAAPTTPCIPQTTTTGSSTTTTTGSSTTTTTSYIPCFNCSGLCSVLNYPQTSLSQINPTVTINGTTYTSQVYQLATRQCANCANIASIPASSDASVLDNLQNGSFVGVFTCPIAMCLCTDKLNATIDCYRGNSSAQIALFAYNQTGNAVILGIVLQSILTRAGSTYSPPTLYPNGTYPSLNSNYLKINHFACVNSTNATNPSVCPNAAPTSGSSCLAMTTTTNPPISHTHTHTHTATQTHTHTHTHTHGPTPTHTHTHTPTHTPTPTPATCPTSFCSPIIVNTTNKSGYNGVNNASVQVNCDNAFIICQEIQLSALIGIYYYLDGTNDNFVSHNNYDNYPVECKYDENIKAYKWYTNYGENPDVYFDTVNCVYQPLVGQ